MGAVRGVSGNRYALVAIAACLLLPIAYTHLHPLQQVFGSTALSPSEWLRALLAGLLVPT